uniref:Peroxiredoxin-like 2A n=1 Tax=Amphimedon queenslandica TaxID=400682 RepID=A0A1X7UT77_AMPQE
MLIIDYCYYKRISLQQWCNYEEAVKVSSLLPELEKLGIPLYGIVSQKTGAKGFKEYLKGDILLDEEKAFYSDRYYLGILRINTFLNYFRASSLYKETRKGDGTLLGSCLVIGPGNTGIIYQYLSREFSDYVDPQEVLKAVHTIHNDNK